MTPDADASAAVPLERHLGPQEADAALRSDVTAGLTAHPKWLPPKWFYDEQGSELFDAITRLPEYYPTRAERALLQAHAGDIAAASRADTLVELGAGTSDKTRLLISALRAEGTLRRFVALDVDASVLLASGASLLREYPGLEVRAVVADFERHLALLPAGGHRLVAFLGSTIGNQDPAARLAFLTSLAATLQPGEQLLLGTDLVKDPDRLVRAYDDSAGVTAAFNRNVLAVINRELKADFDLDSFEHLAVWDAEREWIEMRLRSRRDQRVVLAAVDLEVEFAAGEQMRTEISAKFRREGVQAELAAAGFELEHWWTDPDGDVAVSLARRAGP